MNIYLFQRSLSRAGLIVLLVTAAFLQARPQDGKENAEFKLAVNLYKDGMYDLALQQFKNFAAAYPATAQGIEARFYLGLTQIKLKQYDDARITFQNFALAYVDHPKAPEAWVNVGDAFLALGNEREAASAYERVMIFHPKSPAAAEALLKAGQMYRRVGDREHAKKALRTVIQDYPTSKSVLPARLAISEMYAEEGQTELAEQEARRVAESDVPAVVKASALFSIGKLKASRCLFDDAEDIFKTITSMYKGAAAAYAATYELGTLSLSARKYAAAAELFKNVASEKSADDSLQAKALLGLGSAYAASKDYDNAKKSYEKLFSQFPKDRSAASALWEAAQCAFLGGDAGETLRLLQQLTPSAPKNYIRKSLILAAKAAVSSGNYTDAANSYSAFIDHFSDDSFAPQVALDLGVLYEELLHDFRKAIVTYDRIVQEYPRSSYGVDALHGIARCQEKMNDYENALTTYQEIQSQFPANDQSDYLRDHLVFLQHHKVKNRDSGMEKLALLVGEVLTQKSKAELSFRLGEIYFNDLKDYLAAVKQFSAAIDNGLDEKRFMDAYFFRARAYHLQSEIDSSTAPQAILYYDAYLKQFPTGRWSDDAAFYSLSLKSQTKSPDESIVLGKELLSKRPSSPYRDRVLYASGLSALQTSRYPEAKHFFITLLREAPSSSLLSSTLLQLGRTYLRANQTDSAAWFWKKAASLAPTDRSSAAALWELADAFRRGNNYSEALRLLKRLSGELQYTSFGKMAAAALPGIHFANGAFDEAIAGYENLLKNSESSPFADSSNGEILLSLATAHEKKGDRQRALEYYSRFLLSHRTGPGAGRAFYALGVNARSQGKTSEASSYFKEAAAAGGQSTATADIAALLFQTEQFAEAARQYRQLAQTADSLELKQRYWARVIVSTLRLNKLAEALSLILEFEKNYGKNKSALAEFEYERGSYYYRAGDYANARKVFQKLADDYEDTRFGPWGEYYLGKVLEVNNKLEEAAKRYESVIKKHPDSDVIPRALLSLGNMHFNAERFERAIVYYQRIIDAPDKAGDILPYAMNNLIEAYESTKLYDGALKVTKDFIERYPNDESIIDKKIKVGSLYTKIGYYDQAILHFQNLLDEGGSLLEAEIRYNIGEAYYYKGEYQQAMLEFLKVPYLVAKQGKVNWTATSFYMAGQSYEKLAKYTEAIEMYQQIIDRPSIDATFKAAAKKEIDRVRSLIKKNSQ